MVLCHSNLGKPIQVPCSRKVHSSLSLVKKFSETFIDRHQPAFQTSTLGVCWQVSVLFLIWGILAHSNQPAAISIFRVNIAPYVHHNARSSKGRKSLSRQVLMIYYLLDDNAHTKTRKRKNKAICNQSEKKWPLE